jgi:hypothetical protein
MGAADPSSTASADLSAGVQVVGSLTELARYLDEWGGELDTALVDSRGRGTEERDVLALAQALMDRGDAQADIETAVTAKLQQILAEVTRLEELMEEIRQWEHELDLAPDSGYITMRLARAEAFGKERMYRRRLEEQVRAIPRHVREWQGLQELRLVTQIQRVKKARDILSRLETAVAAGPIDGSSAAQNGGPLKLEELEYYEVTTPATLRQISALPEVYGDPECWEHLFRANREKVKDALSVVPAGTPLVVPTLERSRDFEF